MKKILTIREECRYCKKTHNNALTTYCMFAAKLPALTLPDIIQHRKIRPELRNWNKTNYKSAYFLISDNIVYHNCRV